MQFVYIIVNADRGDGFHRISTGAVESFSTRAIAQENLDRIYFKEGLAILPVPVLDAPTVCPSDKTLPPWNKK